MNDVMSSRQMYRLLKHVSSTERALHSWPPQKNTPQEWPKEWMLRLCIRCVSLQHTAAHCSTLQHSAAHCSTLQYTAALCSTLQHTAAHCSTLQHTAIHGNIMQHTAKQVTPLYVQIQYTTVYRLLKGNCQEGRPKKSRHKNG